MLYLRHFLRQHVCQDVDGVGLGFGCGSSCQEDLQQGNLQLTHIRDLLTTMSGWKPQTCLWTIGEQITDQSHASYHIISFHNHHGHSKCFIQCQFWFRGLDTGSRATLDTDWYLTILIKDATKQIWTQQRHFAITALNSPFYCWFKSGVPTNQVDCIPLVAFRSTSLAQMLHFAWFWSTL